MPRGEAERSTPEDGVSTLIVRNRLAHTATERQILQDIYSPFLVHLVYAFQTADKLYMVLDYVGGESCSSG